MPLCRCYNLDCTQAGNPVLEPREVFAAVASIVIVLEESQPARTVAVRILRHSGFTADGPATPDQAFSHLRESAPGRALVLLSSTLAAGIPDLLPALLRHDPRPTVVLTCAQPGVCPLLPSQGCAELGCLIKPQDFVPATLINRVGAILKGGGLDSPIG